MRRLPLLLALIAAALAALLTCPLPVLDEESYLAIAAQLAPERPYDWWRPWPPWGGEREPDAYVFAHPPLFLLWSWLLSHLPLSLGAIKRLAAAPWAALLAGSAAILAARACRRPGLAAAAWLAAPLVILPLQRGLMPDLAMAALLTAAAAAWTGQRWALAGLALGLAGGVKYPALLLAPALLLDGWRSGRLRASLPCWAAFAAVFLGIELWLLGSYGRVHLVEVLQRAGEIPRGPAAGRGLGELARLPLAVPALLALSPGVLGRGGVLAGLGLAGLAYGLARPDVGLGSGLILLSFAAVGGLVVAAAAGALARGWRRGGPELLLGAWSLLALLGVLVGHNFAAGRYLLPAALPLALLLCCRAESLRAGRILAAGLVVAQAALALGLTAAEHRFAGAADALARAVIAAHPPGAFTGEWTFRWRMEQGGWTFLAGDPPPGALLAAATSSSPGPVPPGATLAQALPSPDRFPLRIIDIPAGVGLYAETLGPLPLGWSAAPLEEVRLWRIP